MTGPQRRAHLVMWLVLGPIAVAWLVLAVLWRPVQPVEEGPLPGVDRGIAPSQPEPIAPGGAR